MYALFIHKSLTLYYLLSLFNLQKISPFFTLLYIYIRRKYLIRENFLTSAFRWIYMFWDVLNTVWPFLENDCLWVYLYVWLRYFVDPDLKNLCKEIDETLYSVATWYNLEFIRVWCVPLSRWCCWGTFSSNFWILISLILEHKIAPNLVGIIHVLRKYIYLWC